MQCNAQMEVGVTTCEEGVTEKAYCICHKMLFCHLFLVWWILSVDLEVHVGGSEYLFHREQL